MNHMVKVIIYNPLFDMDRLMFSLIICKSGLLIFIFAENSYLVRQYIYPHYVEQNTLVPSELGSLCLSFFLSLPLSLSLSLLWSVETHHAHSPAWASKTLLRRRTVPSPPREGAQYLHE